jgi:gentisate 1,2-dioxygenase
MASGQSSAAAKIAPEQAVSAAERVDDTTENASILSADEYFPFVRKNNTRPALWKWSDIKAKLYELSANPLIESERRFCTAVNADTEDLCGVTPFLFLGFLLAHPGEHVKPHRHNSFALYHIVQGKGHTVVEGKSYHWEAGDTLTCPAWASHEHFIEGDEDTIMYTVQDMPILAAGRQLMWEEPIGRENVKHMVLGEEEFGGERARKKA